MRNSSMLTGMLLVLLASRLALPQSLGEIAKKEEERRKTVKTPSKVYTNESLKRDPGGSPAPAGTPPSTPPPASAPPAPAPSAATPATNAPQSNTTKPQTQKDEAYWRNRIGQARDQLERAKTLLDALQSRVNALATDFVNTDDPARRSVIERDRQKALAEMERLKKEIGEQTKAVATIEEEARRGGVPAGWLR